MGSDTELKDTEMAGCSTVITPGGGPYCPDGSMTATSAHTIGAGGSYSGGGSSSSGSKRSRLNLESKCSSLRKHLSKSASELSCNDCGGSGESPHTSPQRARSANAPTIPGVIQRTHGFFNTLRHRWSRARSKERLRGSFGPELEGRRDSQSDYAADNSSAEHSSSATPHQSPRHRAQTLGDSPLAKANEKNTNTNGPVESTSGSIVTGVLKALSTKADIESIGISTTSEMGHQTISGLAKVSETPDTNSLTCLHPADEQQRRRETQLRQHSFFQLRVHLISGHGLVAMDKSGTSDPYVKFKIGGRLLYKSKTVHKDLNPIWDETFVVPVEDPFQPIIIKVFDYDWGLQDDFMGSAKLCLTTLELNRAQDMAIKLEDPQRANKDLGEIKLNVTLWPKTQEDKEQYFQRNPKLADASRRLKSQIWSSVVTIVLIEAKALPPDAENGLNDIYVRFRLGNEKYKSKASYRARWLEQFDLHLFDDDQILELVVCGKYSNYGKCTIDLRSLPRERTHGIWQPLEECPGEVHLMLTISGTTASETITDLTSYKEDSKERALVQSRYIWHKSLQNMRDVGHLTVKVFGATGLAAADIGGKSDPFVVLELINARLQTQTEYKTLTPNWNKIFTFNVKDMSSVLEITVYDEDRDHKVEFLGKVVIPLLRIRNGEKRWYALKDKKMYNRAKGTQPQILLELTVLWNKLRAALRVLEPKEEKLVQQEAKFKRQLFLRNVTRLKAVIMYFIEAGQFIQSCFEWESPIRSFIALVLWICGCIWFDISTIPAVALLYLLKNWLIKWLTGSTSPSTADEYDVASDDEDEEDKEKEEKKTIKERLQAIQEVSQSVQNTIGFLASLGESVKNTFNFSVPELSWLTALLLLVACLVLHYVPMRILLLLWGLAKFSRRIIRPHSVPNNEVLDLLSRVPDDEEIIMWRELPLHSTPEMARRDPRKKHKVS
ncbi:multiple C2 and transmembrane domain-containing protein [Anopheles darlingi]|uniref:multiple C2 and transmembrane domain-containing protein n=1 Tax=Anopheles darlingi TaxID=43151 RepID=UPI00210036AF|nr:multiple C2 and transmembrane domain-containing protein [Anopheles darlingi]XP_049543864.1 multiple C2 and transmembrane domain-containing protein [Anopheles darlingi]